MELKQQSAIASESVNLREQFLASVGKFEKWRIIKNLVVVSLAFMVQFTAFHGTANLQSSINAATGTYTLLSIYVSLMVANIFLPVLVIRFLGCKWTMAFSLITYMPFVAAQLHPTIYTMVPSGLAVGLGGASLWCAKCTYLTILAEAFGILGRKKDSTETFASSKEHVVRFFSIFFFFWQCAQIWGNLISSTILHTESESTSNTTTATTLDVGDFCGANFCPGVVSSTENANLAKPDPERIQLLSLIFLSCMGGAVVLIALFLDSTKRYDMGRSGSGSGLNGCKLFLVTARQLSNKYQLLLIPATFFVGFDHAFVNADFTSGFVACGWGIVNIGYAMTCFGVGCSIGSLLAGVLTKFVGRYVVVVVNAGLHLALLSWMIFWQPDSNGLIYCGLAGVYGCINGIWLVQINSLSGILFPGNEEAAFSNFRFIEAVGSVCAYGISPLLCMTTKLFLMLTLIFLAVTCYSVVEFLEKRRLRKTHPIES